MIFNKEIMFAKTRNSKIQIGIENDKKEEYMYIGHDNVFVQKQLNLYSFNENYDFKYYRNILPYGRTPTYQIFNWRIYPGSYNENYIAVYSDRCSFKYALGFEFPSYITFVYYDIVNQNIKSEVKEAFFIPGNQSEIIMLRSNSLDYHNFIVCFNALTYQKYLPYHEKIFNPYITSQTCAPMYDYLKQKGSTQITPRIKEITGIPTSYTVEFPKVLVWYANKYYTFDGIHFQEITPSSGALINKTDFNTHSFDIDLLNRIPLTTWESNFDLTIDMFLITNGYCLPSQIKSTWWTSKFDLSHYTWVHIKNQKIVFLMGEI